METFMQVLKPLFYATLVFLLASCSCRLRHVGPGPNVPSATSDSALTDINFAFDSYALSTDATKTLKNHAEWIEENDDTNITIEGHTDERGTTEYNLALGANRAKSVYDFLVSKGVSPKRLSTVSYGEELPLDPSHNEAAWARNRRVHFSISE